MRFSVDENRKIRYEVEGDFFFKLIFQFYFTVSRLYANGEDPVDRGTDIGTEGGIITGACSPPEAQRDRIQIKSREVSLVPGGMAEHMGQDKGRLLFC